MSLSKRNPPSSRWPFWLLIVAWFCANSPQSATFALLTWVDTARHFSHQQKLTHDVAYLLAGQESPATLAVPVENHRPEPPPAIPPEATLKKLVLALERTIDRVPTVPRGSVARTRSAEPVELLAEAPPHEPPRARFVA